MGVAWQIRQIYRSISGKGYRSLSVGQSQEANLFDGSHLISITASIRKLASCSKQPQMIPIEIVLVKEAKAIL